MPTDMVKVGVWVPEWLKDQALELVFWGAYKSMSELVRDGMEMALDKNTGYRDEMRKEHDYVPRTSLSNRIVILGRYPNGMEATMAMDEWESMPMLDRDRWLTDNGVMNEMEYRNANED